MIEANLGRYVPILALDSKVHVLNVEERLKQMFPDVSCRVFTDPKKIEEVIGKAPPVDQALVEVIIPEGRAPDIFKAWTESLNETQ